VTLTDNSHWDQNIPVKESAMKPVFWFKSLLLGLAFVGLLLLSQANYLLYHGIVEMLSVVVSVTIFSIGWNTKNFVLDNTLLMLAVAYLSIGALDFLHVLSYKGMWVFPDRGINLPSQLWIAARYMESVSLLFASLLLGSHRRLNPELLLFCSLFTGGLLIALILPFRWFPDCFVEGSGLTTFKVFSEYFISVLLLVTALVFWKKRQHLNRRIFLLLIISVLITILSELSFTLYVDVYGLFNFLGHAFKLISVVLVYLALVQGSLMSPYLSLFRKLSLELAQRKTSEEKLQAVNRELDAFVYTVSHDLRTPLTPIIGFADYLRLQKGEGIDSEGRQLLQKISDLGRGMSETMEDLLTLSKVGKIELLEGPVAVETIVDGVLISHHQQLQEAGQSVHKNALPEAKFPESLLRQVFSNLIGNALRHGGNTEAIEVGGARHGRSVRFYVKDHGQGIPEAERGLVFDLFYRGTFGERTDGTGVGLAIVQKIARLYHGTVWVEETPGGGATFWVEMEEPHEDQPSSELSPGSCHGSV